MTRPATLLLPAAGLLAMVACAIPAYRWTGWSFRDCWWSTWAVYFVIGFCLTVMEARYFASKPPFRGWRPFGFAFIVTGAMAAVAAWIACTSSAGSPGLAAALGRELSRHPWGDWAVRFVGAAGLFTFLYGTIGSATWPFIKRYYQDESFGLELRVPGGRTVIALQLVRGSVITLVLLPLLVAVRAPAIGGVLALALLMVGTMAIGPLTMAPRWPLRLRLIHAIEFALFSLLYAAVVWWLFVFPARAA